MKHFIFLAALAIASLSTFAKPAGVDPLPSADEQLPDSLDISVDNLDELVVVAKKEIVKSDGATLTYDFDADDSSRGQTLLEALKKVPMITIDGEDNVYIKGDSNFRVYVNGKEDPMLTSNYKDVFKAMPADAVSKIEVITEPGAKYDAEGVGGILNLVTERKQRNDGYAGSISLSGGAQNLGANGYIRGKLGKFSADASVNYMDNRLQDTHQTSSSDIIDHNSDINYRQLSEITQRYHFDYLGANLNMGYEISDRDVLSWGGSVRNIKAGFGALDNSVTMWSRSGEKVYSFAQNATGTMQNLGAGGNLSYRHNFNDKGDVLLAGYRFDFAASKMHLNYHNISLYNYDFPYEFQRNMGDNYQREHTATVDYVNILAENHTLETGVKGIIRRNSAFGNNLAGDSFDALSVIDGSTSLTAQIQDVYAGYLSYTGKISSWGLKAGLRYEHTYMGMDFRIGDIPDFRRHLNDLVPNAAVTYMFGPAHNLRLSYQMRISRPGIDMLNPFTFQITQNYAQKGNPDLESEKYHNISLSYSNYGRVLGGNLSFDLSQSNNTIEGYDYFIGDVGYHTYGNIGHNKKAGLNGFLNWNISPVMSVSVNGNLQYTYIKSNALKISNHGWSGSYGVNYSYTGPGDISYSVYGGESSKSYKLQGWHGGWYYYGFSASKSFLKEKTLRVTINASNFLTKNITSHSYILVDNRECIGQWSQRNWNVGVSVSWTFGKLQENTKNAGVNLENDDKKEGKSGFGI